MNATDFNDVDALVEDAASKRGNTKPHAGPKTTLPIDRDNTTWNPPQLDNGKWACNHKCKDKTAYAKS